MGKDQYKFYGSLRWGYVTVPGRGSTVTAKLKPVTFADGPSDDFIKAMKGWNLQVTPDQPGVPPNKRYQWTHIDEDLIRRASM
jgi:hypothetical protein